MSRSVATATASDPSSPSGDSPGNALRRIGVSVRSGLTALTRIPSSAHSSDRPWVMFTSAALLAEYAT